MKFARNAVMILGLSAAVVACDDNGTDVDTVDLSGTYSVETFRYDADEGSASLNLASVPASQGGPYGITSMTVASDHSFEGSMRLPVNGVPTPFDVGGDIEITGTNTVRIDFDQQTDDLEILDDFEDGTFTLAGDLLTLVLPDVTFDFTMSGNEPVDADLTIVASR